MDGKMMMRVLVRYQGLLNSLGRVLVELDLSRRRKVGPGHGLVKKRAQRSWTKDES